jgi:hypothetical protein
MKFSHKNLREPLCSLVVISFKTVRFEKISELEKVNADALPLGVGLLTPIAPYWGKAPRSRDIASFLRNDDRIDLPKGPFQI